MAINLFDFNVENNVAPKIDWCTCTWIKPWSDYLQALHIKFFPKHVKYNNMRSFV